MGRAKLNMDLIQDKKTRQKIFKKRKPGIFKKAKELSILCGIPVLVIIYNQDNTNNHDPLIQCHGPPPPKYGRHRDDNKEPNNHHHDEEEEQEYWCRPENIISKYYAVSPESRRKNNYTVSHFFEDRNSRAEKDLAKLRKESGSVKYPSEWDQRMDAFSVGQLRDVVGYLDNKIKIVREKIDFFKKRLADQSTNIQNQLLGAAAAVTQDDTVLVPADFTTFVSADQQGCSTYTNYHPCNVGGDEWITKPVDMFNYNSIPSMQMPMPIQYYYPVQQQYYQNSYEYAGEWKTMMMMMEHGTSLPAGNYGSAGLTSNSSSLLNNSVNSNLVNDSWGQFMEPAGVGNYNGNWMSTGFGGGGGIEDVVLPCPVPLTSWPIPNVNTTVQQQQQ